jgi:hypothetical protein
MIIAVGLVAIPVVMATVIVMAIGLGPSDVPTG